MNAQNFSHSDEIGNVLLNGQYAVVDKNRAVRHGDLENTAPSALKYQILV